MRLRPNSHVIAAVIGGMLIGAAFLLTAAPASAQDEGELIEQSFERLNAEEEVRLRALLAVPMNKAAAMADLKHQAEARLNAATRLGDAGIRLTVLKEINAILVDSRYRSAYGGLLLTMGEIEKGNLWRQAAYEVETSDFHRMHYLALMAKDAYLQNNRALALEHLAKAESLIATAKPKSEFHRRAVARTWADLYMVKSLMEEQKGNFDAAIVLAQQSIAYGRKATTLLEKTERQQNILNAYGTLLNGFQRKIYAQMQARKLADAEATLQEYLKVFQEVSLPKNKQLNALSSAAWLRFNQREFVAQEKLSRLIIQGYEKLGYEATHPTLTASQSRLALSLFGQKRYADSLAIYTHFDKLALAHPAIKRRLQFSGDRARTYLFNKMHKEALPLLTAAAANNAKEYGTYASGAQHFFTAQATGLQAVALWRIGSAQAKAQAYSLLQASVRGYMAPENTDYLENIGIRKEVRELIFSTYLEAASQLNTNDALAALGIADWLRGGLVQEALGDAAIRAAVSNQALSDLVRQEQDARNEIKGLRSHLEGEADAEVSALPGAAAQMRERINWLEKSRTQIQAQIKAKFPEYEKLVRPLPPSTQQLHAKLKADEALVVLQPTDDAVYVWALGQGGVGAFHRANLGSADLAKLVKRLRASLDVAGLPASRMPAFDAAAALELYQKLLAPVQAGFAGKISLVVAAGGALGQIPFGVLQTNPSVPSTGSGRTGVSANADAPWLIKQAAITHVPSVAAWLSMRSLPHQTAPQPMLAWGDPLFNVTLAAPVRTEPTSVRAELVEAQVRKVNLTRANTAVDLEKEDPKSALKYANIPALPETRDELLAIAKTLGADAAKDIILGSQATRESVLEQNKNGNLAKRRVVAFATHGLMAGDLPNLTQPALAMAGTKDGTTNVLAPLLTLEDVLGLKLNADWVVLSACNTAAADGKAEEALSGLARGFFYAGSRSLLVTHWAVDSDSAVTLTTETFKNYQSKPSEAKAESLRQAMLTVMRDPKTAHPAYWAPYALVGDGAR